MFQLSGFYCKVTIRTAITVKIHSPTSRSNGAAPDFADGGTGGH